MSTSRWIISVFHQVWDSMLWLYLTVLLDRALELYRFRDGDDAFKSNLLLFHSIQKVEVWTLITKEGKEHFSRGGSNLFIGKRFGTICFTCWKGHNYSKHTTGCFYVCGTLFFFALIKTLLTQDVLNLCSVADIMSCNRGFSGTPLERWSHVLSDVPMGRFIGNNGVKVAVFKVPWWSIGKALTPPIYALIAHPNVPVDG